MLVAGNSFPEKKGFILFFLQQTKKKWGYGSGGLENMKSVIVPFNIYKHVESVFDIDRWVHLDEDVAV